MRASYGLPQTRETGGEPVPAIQREPAVRKIAGWLPLLARPVLGDARSLCHLHWQCQ